MSYQHAIQEEEIIEHKDVLDKQKGKSIVNLRGQDFQLSPSELTYLGKIANFTQKLELTSHNFGGNHLSYLEITKWTNLKIISLRNDAQI